MESQLWSTWIYFLLSPFFSRVFLLFHSGAGTSAAAEGGEGAVTGGEGCSGTRTPEAESGAREARAAVVPGGGGPAVSIDTSDSTPPAEEGLGRTVLSAGSSGPPSGLGDVHVHATVGGKSPELVSGVTGTPFFSSQVSTIQDQVAGGAADCHCRYYCLCGERPDRQQSWDATYLLLAARRVPGANRGAVAGPGVIASAASAGVPIHAERERLATRGCAWLVKWSGGASGS